MIDPHPIGASEVAVAVGLGRRREYGRRAGEPYQSELDLALRLRGDLPRYDDGPEGRAAGLGKVYEPGIGIWYAQREGLTVGVDLLPGPQIPSPGYSVPDLPFLAVRPDFLDLRDGRTVEAKAPDEASEASGWGMPGTAEVPAYHYCQITAQLAVAYRQHGWTRADLVVVARSTRSPIGRAVYTLHRDPAREDRILTAAARWYDRHVIRRIDPAPDGSESAGSALARRWRPTDTTTTASEETIGIVARLREIRAARSRLDLEESELTQAVQAEVGPSTALVDAAGTILATWRPRKGSARIDADRLRSDHPEIAEKYTTTGQPGRAWSLK